MPEWASLAPLHRALLVAGGTMTDLLEALFSERMTIAIVAQDLRSAADGHPALECAAAEPILDRRVVVRGSRSRRAYVRAASQICVDRLPSAMFEALQRGDTPLGTLIEHFQLETLKRVLEVLPQDSAEDGRLEPVLTRTYLVINSGRPLMVIHEEFPASLCLPDR